MPLDARLLRGDAPAPASHDDALDLVILALPHWGGDYMKSTVALAQAWARAGHRVLYVEHPPTLATHLRRRTWPGVRAALRIEPVAEGRAVHVLTPAPALPMNALPPRLYGATLALNARALRWGVRRAMRRLGMDAPVVVSALCPHYGAALAGGLGERLRAYYLYDELRARPWNGRHGARLEQRFLKAADLVVATSPALAASRRAAHPSVHLVPNGVDAARFAEGASTRTPGAAPCIGYVGSLDARVDYDALHALCAARPGWRFRLVGRVVAEAARALSRHPNVTLVGPRPPEALPGELRQMDAGLIPFVRDAFTRCIYPLKANEYLAAAKPVVATAFADLSDFAGLIEVVPPGHALAPAVERALASDTPPMRGRRRRKAEANTWTRRADAFIRLLRYHLASADAACP
jgi:glycosyltransferase involved in cell wall biosynthesis